MEVCLLVSVCVFSGPYLVEEVGNRGFWYKVMVHTYLIRKSILCIIIISRFDTDFYSLYIGQIVGKYDF